MCGGVYEGVGVGVFMCVFVYYKYIIHTYVTHKLYGDEFLTTHTRHIHNARPLVIYIKQNLQYSYSHALKLIFNLANTRTHARTQHVQAQKFMDTGKTTMGVIAAASFLMGIPLCVCV
jgi:hypothetical protein